MVACLARETFERELRNRRRVARHDRELLGARPERGPYLSSPVAGREGSPNRGRKRELVRGGLLDRLEGGLVGAK